jgi:hypothetical protein
VLVLDGLFLHRDELHDLWELSVFLDVPFDVTAARMAARDGSSPDPHHPSMRRYVDAQRTYFESCSPAKRADLVIDNSDWDRPALQADRYQRNDQRTFPGQLALAPPFVTWEWMTEHRPRHAPDRRLPRARAVHPSMTCAASKVDLELGSAR